jgi:cyclophilin family peptidyl-prolyl cis-trans isomerase
MGGRTESLSKLVLSLKGVRKMSSKFLAAVCGAVVLTVGLAAAQTAPAEKKDGPKLAPGTYAHFVTSEGNFTVKLLETAAPKTVANFVGLAEGTLDPITGKPGRSKPYYNGLTFHRIIDGFMIQGGDPTGTGTGGPGYRFADEIDAKHKFDKAGIMAMANAGPNTNGSQFFVTVAPYPQLPTNYTIFGEVVDGLDVVKKIGKVKTGANDRPLVPVVMKTVTIERVK